MRLPGMFAIKGLRSKAESAVSSAAQLRWELAADAVHCLDGFARKVSGIPAAERHFRAGQSIETACGVSADAGISTLQATGSQMSQRTF